MNPHDERDEQALQALMENLPMSKYAPDVLKSKLADLAGSAQPKHRAVRRPVFAFAGVSLLLVAAVASFMSLPATAKSWTLIKQAVKEVESMELTIKQPDEKETVKVAFAPGKILVQPEGQAVVFVSNGTVQIYDKGENVVRELPMPSMEMIPDIGGIVLKELNLSKMLSDYEKQYGRENIKIGHLRQWQGRTVYDATLTDPKEGGHARIVADAATDLPIFIEAYEKRNGELVKAAEITARYNEMLSPDAFKPNWPKDAKIVKFDMSKIFEEGKKGGGNPFGF